MYNTVVSTRGKLNDLTRSSVFTWNVGSNDVADERDEQSMDEWCLPHPGRRQGTRRIVRRMVSYSGGTGI
jgi:hypothetical protein